MNFMVLVRDSEINPMEVRHVFDNELENALSLCQGYADEYGNGNAMVVAEIYRPKKNTVKEERVGQVPKVAGMMDNLHEYREEEAVRRKRELERISELWNEEPTARLNALDNIRREQP